MCVIVASEDRLRDFVIWPVGFAALFPMSTGPAGVPKIQNLRHDIRRLE